MNGSGGEMTERTKVKAMIKLHEGYKDNIYKDSVGVLTCGWGHALHEGSYIGRTIAEILFEKDFQDAVDTATQIEIENGLTLNETRHAVLTDMAYNLGYAKLCKFKNFIDAMQKKEWERAADEMLDSKWAQQVKGRARTLSYMMEYGRW